MEAISTVLKLYIISAWLQNALKVQLRKSSIGENHRRQKTKKEMAQFTLKEFLATFHQAANIFHFMSLF